MPAYAAFFRGTLAPARRAFDNPIAIACFRFLCSPCCRWCISVLTSCCAFGPYFEWPFRDRLLLPDLLPLLLAELRDREDDDRRERDAELRLRAELVLRGLRRAVVERLRDVRLLDFFEAERERDDVRFFAVLRDERFADDFFARDPLLERRPLRDDDFFVVGIRLILP